MRQQKKGKLRVKGLFIFLFDYVFDLLCPSGSLDSLNMEIMDVCVYNQSWNR